jgi:hypothetical protein
VAALELVPARLLAATISDQHLKVPWLTNGGLNAVLLAAHNQGWPNVPSCLQALNDLGGMIVVHCTTHEL